MKKNGLMVMGIIAGTAVLGFMMFGGVYNQLVTKDEGVTGAWAQVENVYQRRADLIPNLVNTVKGYAEHEKETLQGVVDARAKVGQMNVSADLINDPAAMAKFEEAQGALTSALSRLLVSVERYPELKASQNFLALQTQLEGTENRISVERRRFNEAARDFNTYRRKFPNMIIANMGGFKAKAYFEADQGANKAPKVEF